MLLPLPPLLLPLLIPLLLPLISPIHPPVHNATAASSHPSHPLGMSDSISASLLPPNIARQPPL
jgi:hypothetical protein